MSTKNFLHFTEDSDSGCTSREEEEEWNSVGVYDFSWWNFTDVFLITTFYLGRVLLATIPLYFFYEAVLFALPFWKKMALSFLNVASFACYYAFMLSLAILSLYLGSKGVKKILKLNIGLKDVKKFFKFKQ